MSGHDYHAFFCQKSLGQEGSAFFRGLAFEVLYQQGLFINERQALSFMGWGRAGSRIRSWVQQHLCPSNPLALHFRANCASFLLSILIAQHNYWCMGNNTPTAISAYFNRYFSVLSFSRAWFKQDESCLLPRKQLFLCHGMGEGVCCTSVGSVF